MFWIWCQVVIDVRKPKDSLPAKVQIHYDGLCFSRPALADGLLTKARRASSGTYSTAWVDMVTDHVMHVMTGLHEMSAARAA